MATQNPRVAAYVPQVIYDHLKNFRDERSLKSDSQAIIFALTEFFGVSQEVAHQSDSNLVQRIESLEARFSQLKEELLSELKSELFSDDKNTDQLELISLGSMSSDAKKSELVSEPIGDSNHEPSNSNELGPLTAEALTRRFGLARAAVAKAKGRFKDRPEKFTAWSCKHDPDDISWEYRENTNLYHPLFESTP
jgi:hypothetical protein